MSQILYVVSPDLSTLFVASSVESTQISIFLCRVLSDENSVWLLDNLVPSLSGHLFALRLLLRSLKDLPDYIVAHSASSHGNKVREKDFCNACASVLGFLYLLSLLLLSCEMEHLSRDKEKL